MLNMKYFIFILFLTGLVWSCNKETDSRIDYQFTKPDHFPPTTYNLAGNPISEKGFKLGKKLFNDPILSNDYSIACSNCHVKSVAFTDPQHRLSLGVNERQGTRNTPSIANMAFMKEFVWDGGIIHLDFVPPNAIENPNEMDLKLDHLITRLNKHHEYPALFRNVFKGIDSITTPYVLKALSQYQLLLISSNSKYDHYVQGLEKLTLEESNGKKLFDEKCSVCHSGPLFTNQSYQNNGLDLIFSDEGRARITETSKDMGKFKVPSLRNVSLTAPYMHDGRFADLGQVLDHYSEGVKRSSTLSPILINNDRMGIPLTKEEKGAIITFLKTLTDYEFINDERF